MTVMADGHKQKDTRARVIGCAITVPIMLGLGFALVNVLGLLIAGNFVLAIFLPVLLLTGFAGFFLNRYLYSRLTRRSTDEKPPDD